MNKQTKIYFKNFDGLRFFAALAVICAHYVTVFSDVDPSIGKWQKVIFSLDNSGAEAGVNFFFVLSGFLITYLILTESETTHLSSIANFYMRRILRIWPLYFLSISFGFLIYPLLTEIPNYVEAADWRMYVLFLANLDQIYFQNNPVHPNPLLGVHWSIAVEEQFYLIWPWIFFFARKQFVWVGLTIWVTSVAFQALTGLPSHTISSFQDLVAGALLAFFCVYYPNPIQWIFDKIAPSFITIIYLLGMAVVAGKFQLTRHIPFYDLIFRTIHAVIFSFIILDQGFNKRSPLPCANIPLISYFGKISYGLYLLHPVSIFVVKLWLFPLAPSWSILPIVIILSLLISALSYQFFENYFLKLKLKYK